VLPPRALLAGGVVLGALFAPPAAALTVTVDSGPPNPSSASTATFKFHATGAAGAVSFGCDLDGGGFAGCSSPASYSALRNGDHLFSVRGTDNRGANDTAQYRWTVDDREPPDTTITSGPSATTPSGAVTFTFTASEPGSGFICSLDGGMPTGCGSPRSYVDLAAGPHTFSVSATDVNGNGDPSPAMYSFTVAPAVGDRANPVGGSPAGASVAPLALHGPYRLTRSRMARYFHRGPRRPYLDLEHADDEAAAAAQPPCSSDLCASATSGEDLSIAIRPSPLVTKWDANIGGIDPQVAAGDKSFLVLANQGAVAFYDKGGDLLSKDKNGYPLPYKNPIPDASFFSWLLGIVNNKDTLNLPGTYGTKKNPDGSLYYGLDDVYDTRVIWDGYRKRFWIAAQGRNDGARNGSDTEKLYRRDVIFFAVSVSADPRDGFYMYWWFALPGDGQCNPGDPDGSCPSGFKPGYGADYISLGISKYAFVESEYAGGADHHYGIVNVVRADKVVADSCDAQCGWSYWDIPAVDGNGVAGPTVQPAVEHGPSPYDGQYLMTTAGDHTLALYGFTPTDPFPPTLYQASADIQPYARAVDVPQKPNADITKPRQVNIGSNLFKGQMTKSVFRDGQLYGLLPDCTKWPGESACITSIRLVRADPLQHTVSIDRSFGQRGPGDAPDALVGYGTPILEVNEDGTMVMGYQRSGSTIFPQARYSVRYADEPDNRPSYVLKKGTYPLSTQLPDNPSEDDLKPTGRLDISGAGVDPYDDAGVWLIQDYALKNSTGKGQYQHVVAKIFGSVLPDLWVSKKSLSVKLGARGSKKVAGAIGNQGDGDAKKVKVTVFLVPLTGRAGRTIKLGSDALGTVDAGSTHNFTVAPAARTRLAKASYRVKVTVSSVTKPEYDSKNNSALGPTIKIG
jgi:hypothetical protein